MRAPVDLALVRAEGHDDADHGDGFVCNLPGIGIERLAGRRELRHQLAKHRAWRI